MAEGGIWDQSGEVYPLVGGVPKLGDMSWSFPPYSNTISFSHLEHEQTKYNWSSSQICAILFDEIQLFSETQVMFMLSRNRSLCGVQPYVRGACNPDPGWLKRFLAPWVDDEFKGVRAQSGEVRWYLRNAGEIQWVAEGTEDAKSLSFVRSSVYDNKILLERNPEYIANLKALPPVDRARLLEGNWNVRAEGLVYHRPQDGIDYQTCIVDELPIGLEGQPLGGIDFGFHNPFAAPAGTLDHDDVLWITYCRYQSNTTLPIHSEALPKGVRWWCDPAQPESIVLLRQAGHDCLACRHKAMRGASGETKSPKLAGIDMVCERIRTGRLKILRSACQPLIREFGLYRYDPMKLTEEPIDADNHALDALRYLIVGSTRGHAVPSVISPDELRDQAKARESVIEAQLRQRQQDAQQARHEDISDPLWWDGDSQSDTLELIVEASDPDSLDKVVMGFGNVMVVQDADGKYVQVGDAWLVRCFGGTGGYVAHMIAKHGHGKVLRRRRV